MCKVFKLKKNGREYSSNKFKFFLDWVECDIKYLHKEIPFINLVRDPETSQVHILISDQNTAGQGKKYYLNFIGRENFVGQNHELVFDSYVSDSESTIRDGIMRKMKIGIMIYVLKTETANQIEMTYSGDD